MTTSADQLALIVFHDNKLDSQGHELIVKDNIVVPSSFIVKKGVVPFRHWPKNETSLPLLKQMLGAKKKKIVQEEEEKEEIPVVEEQDDSDHSDESSQSEQVEDEDD